MTEAKRSEPLWCVDIVNADLVSGWAIVPAGRSARIEVHVNGRLVGEAILGLPRPDVAAAFPDAAGAAESGFSYLFPSNSLGDGPTQVDVEVHLLGNWDARSHVARVPVLPLHAVPTDRVHGPVAAPVLALLQQINPAFRTSEWNAALTFSAAQNVGYLARSASRRVQGLFPYLGYLAACDQHARLVERHFPRTNDARRPSDKDFPTVQSSGFEMLAIAHHLWVLASHGVEGAVLEFGCFKGFSTSVLSFACALLGRRLHVFDSFAGLPPSSDGFYQTGDFAGSFDEVVANVTQFGRPDVVSFHRGFFEESVPRWQPERVACIWMDVDLESSARDALQVFPWLSPRGALFSHECAATSFRDGQPAPVPGPTDVVQPIVDAFAASGRVPTGHFIAGNTGVFWDAAQGLPVLTREALEHLDGIARSLSA